MTDSQRMRFVIEVDPGDPICGSVAREGGPRIPFEGMLGLLSLFERLLNGGPPAADRCDSATEDQPLPER